MVGYSRKGGKFHIGYYAHEPVVAGEDLRHHLRLLAAFQALRRRASQETTRRDAPPAYSEKESDQESSLPLPPSTSTTERGSPPAFDDEANSASLWNTFLVRALHRFEVYLEKVLTPTNTRADPRPRFRNLILTPHLIGLSRDGLNKLDDEPEPRPFEVPDNLLPPLDVALIWHSYMLNPSRYIEDAHLVPTRYVLLRVRFPLAKLARRLEGDGINIIANDARGNWQGLTGLAFDPFGADAQPLPSPQEAVSLEGTVVRCPNSACKAEQPLSWQQAAQPDWSIKCPSCSLLIRKETLLGKRFFDDMNVWRSRGSDTNGWRMRGGVLSKANGKPFHKDPYNPILYRLVQSNRKLSGTNEDARGKKIFDSTVDVIGKIEQGKATTPQTAFESERYDIEAISKSIYDRLSPGLDEAQRKQLYRRVSLMMSYYIDSHPLSPASLDLVAAVQRQFGFVDEMDSLGWLSGQLPSRELQEGLDNAIVRYHGWLNLSFRYPTAFISPTLDIDLAWHTHQLSPDYYTDCFRLLGRFLDHDDKVEKGRLGDAFQDTADLWRKLYDQPYSWCGCAEHRKKFATAKKLLSKLKGKSRARDDDDEDDAGEAAEEAPEGSIPTHPSAHNAVQVGEDSESVREKQDTTEEKSVKKVMSASSGSGSGTRDGRQQHDNPFKRDYANMAPFLYIPAAHEAGGAVPGKCGLDTVGAGACLGGQASMINDRFARVMNIESNRLTMGSSGYPAYSGVGFVAMGGFGNCGGGGGGCGGGGGGCGGGGGGC